MNVIYTDTFIKHFHQRIKPHPNINAKFNERTRLFVTSPSNPILFVKDNHTYFADIGTHNQVY